MINDVQFIVLMAILGILSSVWIFKKYGDQMYVWYIPYVLIIVMLYIVYSRR